MDCCRHHGGKWRLSIEGCRSTIPVQVSPGIGQVKAEMIAQHINVKGIHKHGENQGTDYREEHRALDISLYLTRDVGGELEADELEEYDTHQASKGDQAGK